MDNAGRRLELALEEANSALEIKVTTRLTFVETVRYPINIVH